VSTPRPRGLLTRTLQPPPSAATRKTAFAKHLFSKERTFRFSGCSGHVPHDAAVGKGPA